MCVSKYSGPSVEYTYSEATVLGYRTWDVPRVYRAAGEENRREQDIFLIGLQIAGVFRANTCDIIAGGKDHPALYRVTLCLCLFPNRNRSSASCLGHGGYKYPLLSAFDSAAGSDGAQVLQSQSFYVRSSRETFEYVELVPATGLYAGTVRFVESSLDSNKDIFWDVPLDRLPQSYRDDSGLALINYLTIQAEVVRVDTSVLVTDGSVSFEVSTRVWFQDADNQGPFVTEFPHNQSDGIRRGMRPINRDLF